MGWHLHNQPAPLLLPLLSESGRKNGERGQITNCQGPEETSLNNCVNTCIIQIILNVCTARNYMPVQEPILGKKLTSKTERFLNFINDFHSHRGKIIQDFTDSSLSLPLVENTVHTAVENKQSK